MATPQHIEVIATELAVGAVIGEPLSSLNSLLSGNFAGNSVKQANKFATS